MQKQFSVQTQLQLAKYYMETERAKTEWRHVILKIGKPCKDPNGGKSGHQVRAQNLISNVQVQLFIEKSVIENQNVGAIRELLLKAGANVPENEVHMYFQIHDKQQ